MKDVFKEILKFFSDNSSQGWTLLSVIVGGIVTYISTSAVERRKNKRQSQKDNMEQILIPFCTCLEKTSIYVKSIYQDTSISESQTAFETWINRLKSPNFYLSAAKRVYLPENIRLKLEDYEKLIEIFEAMLEQEYNAFIERYTHYISEALFAFPDVSPIICATPFFKKHSEAKIKVAILCKNEFSLLQDLTHINFVTNDDPDNYQVTSVTISDSIKKLYEKIEIGLVDISKIDDPETVLSYHLLEFLLKHTAVEVESINNIIDKTKSSINLSSIMDLLNELKKELLKEIDKIAT